ncbi:hypothetical protein LAZ40_05580 [Cereibacter sphaeroides]|uniref:hypothetical protein n=1 Tax=Cereibacter sphaeroides TaxID=1063 RepID=UPI001F3FFF15|nr:hypothetical protein [Cereibacter sphaeroides]MCE6958520.1 hypothetical protein [Cereibacter sphaeroides]MCE6972818.1 hypothetical protein [Cereibacter sphaeroides]
MAASHGAIIQVAIWFHDIGKAILLFQDTLRRSLKRKRNDQAEADPVRHEAISALAWDQLFGGLSDEALLQRLSTVTCKDIDNAMSCAAERAFAILGEMQHSDQVEFPLEFVKTPGSLAFFIGMLILGHHRLPDTDMAQTCLLADRHFRRGTIERRSLDVAPGKPFWHQPGWIERLRQSAAAIRPDTRLLSGSDIFARTCLMLGDHLGSALKEPGDGKGHLANTAEGADGRRRAMDNLETHVRRVMENADLACRALYEGRNDFPALDEGSIPSSIRSPETSDERFRWQPCAADATAREVATGAGGFFACIVAGTGTGKTRGAPTILAAATLADVVPERRGLRFVLGLGLRTLATQSAAEYVANLAFPRQSVAVLVGTPPLEFPDNPRAEASEGEESGSEDRLRHLASFNVEAGSDEPGEEWGSAAGRDLAAFCSRFAKKEDRNGVKLNLLLTRPVLCMTIDHLMPLAAPARSRHLHAALRMIGSDLILDEIDQYDAEDLAAVGRLVHLAGVAGRRVIIMSATLPDVVASSLHAAYRAGWSEHAALFGLPDRVHHCITGHVPDSCRVGQEGFMEHLAEARAVLLEDLQGSPALRRSEVVEAGGSLAEAAVNIGRAASEMHDRHAVSVGDLRVSIGLVRLTRIAHVAAVTSALPDAEPGRLRLRVCLHSRMPRIQRAWIERMLKGALTRKGADPHAGLRKLLESQNVHRRAEAAGAREVEIVVVASPVIETGNDCDFDWGILDPSSLRAIIQSAGRVNRHRCAPILAPNIALLSRPLVTLEQPGLIAWPGVETRPDPATGIAQVNVTAAPVGSSDRSLVSLYGGEVPERIDAEPFLDPGADFPMLRAETLLFQRFLAEGKVSLETWTTRYLARHTVRFHAMRRFRRSNGIDVEIFAVGDDVSHPNWRQLYGATDARPTTFLPGRVHPLATRRDFLFEDGSSSLEKAWAAMFPDGVVTPERLRRMTGMTLQLSSADAEIEPLVWDVRYGLIRPIPESCLAPS